MSAVNAGFLHNRISKFSHGRRRLDGENVEAGANTPGMDGFDQRRFINNFTTRSIDEISTIAHSFEKIRANQHSRIRLERHVNAHNVRGCGHIKRALHPFNSQLKGAFLSQASTPRNDRHTESAGAWNHLLTYFPQTH